ncbi:MAG: DUF542 domain-containing protein [Sandaracinus sp.]
MTQKHLESSMLVRDLLREHPAALSVLDRYRIDWCCGAGRTLEHACAEAGTTVGQLADEVARVEAEAGARALDVRSFEQMSLADVVAHVEHAHHQFSRTEGQRLRALATKVARRHGSSHAELLSLERAVHSLFDELDRHMVKEERVLFPAIRALELGEPPGLPSFAGPVSVMRAEHEHAGALLAQIAALTENFRAPAEACASWRGLYDGLLDHDADLRHHVWLENEIVFPRALAAMQAAQGARRRQA